MPDPGRSTGAHRGETRRWLIEGVTELRSALAPFQRILISSHDWGMALLLARQAGPHAKVLLSPPEGGMEWADVAAWLLAEEVLGGFACHASGSVLPILKEIANYEGETRARARCDLHPGHFEPGSLAAGRDRSAPCVPRSLIAPCAILPESWDVAAAIAEWRASRRVPADPIAALLGH